MMFIVIFLLLFGFWIFAEARKLGFLARFGSGLACMAVIAFTIAFIGRIIPGNESDFHRADMLRMEVVLTNGDTQSAIQAVHIYNTIAATGSTYRAARQMGEALYKVDKH